jgi:isochorismate synthase
VSANALFERARAEARRGSKDAIVVATLRAPHLPRSFGSPLVAWEPASGPKFAGWGEAIRIDASGIERFDEARKQGILALSRVVELRADDAELAPPARLFGGFAFAAASARDVPWQAFGDASFTMPAIRFATDDGVTWLSLALDAGEAAQSGAFDRALASALAIAERHPERAANEASIAWPPRAPWVDTVEDALARIEDHAFKKVVAATVCRVACARRPSLEHALATLATRYPSSTRFAFERSGSVFLGASPETLVELADGVARADALAGTIPRGDDDEASKAALLASDKERREHAAVVDAVRIALGATDEFGLESKPEMLVLRNVIHLRTPVAARVDASTHVVDLVRHLHPTPAVAGAPREAALAWLVEHEPAGRGWYAGPVGWFDARGEGSFRVAIRSGVIEGARAWLYAGAGIVAGSDPSREYLEVQAKLAPMLEALEASP